MVWKMDVDGNCDSQKVMENNNVSLSAPPDTPINFEIISAPVLKTGNTCWGCENCFDRQHINAMSQSVTKLLEVFSQNVERISIVALGKLMEQKFIELICKPILQSNRQKAPGEPHEKMPIWTAAGILLHFKDHVVDPVIQLKYTIENLTVIGETMIDQVHLREGATGNTITDVPKADAYIRLEKYRLQLVDQLQGKRGKH